MINFQILKLNLVKNSVKFIAYALLLLSVNCSCLPENQDNETYTEFGKASWYGPGFQGKKTANGENFDMNYVIIFSL